MKDDIKPYTGFNLLFQRDIEPRRLELAELMANRSGKTTKIAVRAYKEPRKHLFEVGDKPGLCYCSDCAGDFSGASYDEEWGGR